MDKVIAMSAEPRKEWVTPELRKVDIELITAGTAATDSDLDFSGS
jgi:hypothetical protein